MGLAGEFPQRVARRVKKDFWQSYPSTLLRPPRRFHLFGVGTPKSGTTSLWSIFRRHYRAEHEPDLWRVSSTVIARLKNEIGEDQVADFLVRHDRLNWLELNSSCMNVYFLDPIIRNYVDAKFILTVRDCYSFASSIIDDCMNTPRPKGHLWPIVLDLQYKVDRFSHAPAERILSENGLHTLDGYFSYWAEHISTVLRQVPEDRLLVLRTDKVSKSLDRLADFAGVPTTTLELDQIS